MPTSVCVSAWPGGHSQYQELNPADVHHVAPIIPMPPVLAWQWCPFSSGGARVCAISIRSVWPHSVLDHFESAFIITKMYLEVERSTWHVQGWHAY